MISKGTLKNYGMCLNFGESMKIFGMKLEYVNGDWSLQYGLGNVFSRLMTCFACTMQLIAFVFLGTELLVLELSIIDFILLLCLLMVTVLAIVSEYVYVVLKDKIPLHFEAILHMNQYFCKIFEIINKKFRFKNMTVFLFQGIYIIEAVFRKISLRTGWKF